MKWIVKNRRAGLGVGWHTGNDSGWEMAFDLVLGYAPWVRVICVGWGWDKPVPLRPWPQLWWKRTTRRGNVTSGVAWLGFFANIGRAP